MGGKKTVGAHPTRGHYHNSNSSGRPHPHGGEAGVEIPFTQEFSLFCADDIAEHSSAASHSSAGALASVSGTGGGDFALAPEFGQWFHTSGSAWGGLQGSQWSHSQIADIETQLESIRRSIYNLETSLRSGDHKDTDSSSKKQSGAKMSSEQKRLQELLKTVEGRQKSIQSKMSHLDSLFGPSSADWAQGTDRLRFIMEYFDMMQTGFNPPPPPAPAPPALFPPQFQPQYSPYFQGGSPYSYQTGNTISPPSYTSYIPGNRHTHGHEAEDGGKGQDVLVADQGRGEGISEGEEIKAVSKASGLKVHNEETGVDGIGEVDITIDITITDDSPAKTVTATDEHINNTHTAPCS
jgi:hypothetical protein